jgi:heme A synthase
VGLCHVRRKGTSVTMSSGMITALLALVLFALLFTSRGRDKLIALLGVALGAQLAGLAAGAMVRHGSASLIGYLISLAG